MKMVEPGIYQETYTYLPIKDTRPFLTAMFQVLESLEQDDDYDNEEVVYQ